MKTNYSNCENELSELRKEFQQKNILENKLRNAEFFQKNCTRGLKNLDAWLSCEKNLSRFNELLENFDSEEELWYYLSYPFDRPEKHVCTNCGNEISFAKWRTYSKHCKSKFCSNECSEQHRKIVCEETCLKKYGWKNNFHARRIKKEKIEYFCECCSKKLKNNEKNICGSCNKEKIKQEYMLHPKCCEICGNALPFEKRNRETCSNTCAYELTHRKTRKHLLETYGFENALQIKKFRDKFKETCIKRYGTENPTSNVDIRNKIKNTNLERWGCENPRQNKEIQKKAKETCLKKYGVVCPLNINQGEKIDKSIETKLKKYGSLAINCHRFCYDDLRFDSKDELYFYLYHKEILKDSIERGPTFRFEFENKTHRYECDFKIDSELFEIKSSHLFKDGKLYFPYSEDKETKQSLWDKKTEIMRQNNVYVILTNSDEMNEIIRKVDEVFTKDFVTLFDVHAEFPYPNEKLTDKSDLGLIHHFHKSIYSAHRKGKMSPLEAWKDKNLVKEIALNRLKYVGHCSLSDIVQGFNVTLKAPKVSTFSPSTAKDLISKYLVDCETIADPFSGFSGRLLGAESCSKKYFGFDINIDHVKESNEIINFRNFKNSNIVVRDILSDFEKETYDCLFTCPPYGAKEHWNEKNDEIEKSCDEWIDVCLDKFQCRKYLFVVDETEKYKDFVVEELVKKSHFGERKEQVILINKGENNDQ